MMRTQQRGMAPQQYGYYYGYPTSYAPTQEVGDIISMIMPIMMLVLVFGMMMPMIKQMGTAFS